jgi:hypothetical protein
LSDNEAASDKQSTLFARRSEIYFVQRSLAAAFVPPAGPAAKQHFVWQQVV